MTPRRKETVGGEIVCRADDVTLSEGACAICGYVTALNCGVCAKHDGIEVMRFFEAEKRRYLKAKKHKEGK